ncbi:hypothetical protein ACO0QE_001597 [Hanseniaspora vineae]
MAENQYYAQRYRQDQSGAGSGAYGDNTQTHAHAHNFYGAAAGTNNSSASINYQYNNGAASTKVLPKTDYHSPYYIAVPTPRGTALGINGNTSTTTTTTTTTTTATPMSGGGSNGGKPSLKKGSSFISGSGGKPGKNTPASLLSSSSAMALNKLNQKSHALGKGLTGNNHHSNTFKEDIDEDFEDAERDFTTTVSSTSTNTSNEYPTTIIVDRFYKWKKILKALIAYFREIALAQEQFARINNNLRNSVKFQNLLPNLLDNGQIVMGTTSTTKTTTSSNASNSASALGGYARPSAGRSNSSNTAYSHLDNDNNADYFSDARSTASSLARPKLTKSKTNVSTHSIGSGNSSDQYDIESLAKEQQDFSSNPAALAEQQALNINTGDYLPFGSGSIQDLQVILKKYHMSLAQKQYEASQELDNKIIPRLEDLKKDLKIKLQEIKELHDDFKTNIKQHVALTGQLLNKYMSALNIVENNDGQESVNTINKSVYHSELINPANNFVKPKNDPYLLKLQLDLQLKRQLLEEHYLQDSYTNLQKNGLELEKIIYLEIQKALSKYTNLIDAQIRLQLQALCHDLQLGILSKPPAVEWDNFISNHPQSLLNWKSNDPLPIPRKLNDIKYPLMKSPLARCIRAGYLYKKNKFLKNYSKSYFVMTSNYLHEFKSADFFKSSTDKEDLDDALIKSNAKSLMTPIMSISLNDCILTEFDEEKFVLKNTKPFADSSFDSSNMSTSTLNELNRAEGYKGSTDNLGQPHKDKSKNPKKKISSFLKKHSSTAHLNQHEHDPSLSKSKGLPKTSSSASLASKVSSSSPSLSTLTSSSSSSETTWTFKIFIDPAGSTELEQKQIFKKWVQDLKHLTSFTNAMDRSKYIQEKILALKNLQHMKLQQQRQARAAANAGALGQNAMGNRKFKMNLEMPPPPVFNPANIPQSTTITPSIDDNGNLITASDPKPFPDTPQAKPFEEPKTLPVPASLKEAPVTHMRSQSTDNATVPFQTQAAPMHLEMPPSIHTISFQKDENETPSHNIDLALQPLEQQEKEVEAGLQKQQAASDPSSVQSTPAKHISTFDAVPVPTEPPMLNASHNISAPNISANPSAVSTVSSTNSSPNLKPAPTSRKATPPGQQAANGPPVGGGYFSIPVTKKGPNSGKNTPQTLQSAASLARQSINKPQSPPASVKSAGALQSLAYTAGLDQQTPGSKTITTTTTTYNNPNNAFKKGHRKISSLSSLTSLGGLRKSSASKLSNMPEAYNEKLASQGGKVDIFKSLYD